MILFSQLKRKTNGDAIGRVTCSLSGVLSSILPFNSSTGQTNPLTIQQSGWRAMEMNCFPRRLPALCRQRLCPLWTCSLPISTDVVANKRRLPLTDIPILENREDRYGKTERKHLTLTTEAVAAVQAYADQHGLYFSVAVETLALMGLGQTTAETLPRLVTNLLERAFNRQFNRFAKLISLAAIAAEEANYKADVLLLQTIWREARLNPDNFLAQMQVSADPQKQPDALARQVRDELSAAAHDAAVTRLKKPLGENNLFVEEETAHA